MKFLLSRGDPYVDRAPLKIQVKQYGIAKIIIVRKEEK
jgi:hypothetical protein